MKEADLLAVCKRLITVCFDLQALNRAVQELASEREQKKTEPGDALSEARLPRAQIKDSLLES